MNENLINIEHISLSDGNTLDIRTGKLPDIQVRQPFTYTGAIESVCSYLKERYDNEVAENGVLLINWKKGEITLDIDPKNNQAGKLIGRLTPAVELSELQLNKEMNFDDFRKHIKRIRRFFASDETFTGLMSSLNNFKAKATIEIENTKDNRGNLKNSVERIADTDLIESFSVVVPLYYNEDKVRLEIDLNYDLQGQSLVFWLECPTLVETAEKYATDRLVFELNEIRLLKIPGTEKGFTVPILHI